MTQPGSDRVDVYTRMQQVCCGCVPDYVRAYSLLEQRRNLHGSTNGISLHERMDTEACQRSATTIEEDVVARFTTGRQGCQFNRRFRPYWATAGLVSLAMNQDGRRTSPRCLWKIQIVDLCLSSLVGAGPRIVEKQQYRIVAPSLGRMPIGGRQDGVHFRLVQIGHGGMRALF